MLIIFKIPFQTVSNLGIRGYLLKWPIWGGSARKGCPPFSGFRCIKGQGLLLLKYVKRAGNLSLRSQAHFMAVKKQENFLVQRLVHSLKAVHLQQLKKMQLSKLVRKRGAIFSIKDMRKGSLFCQKLVPKRVRGWTSGYSFPV